MNKLLKLHNEAEIEASKEVERIAREYLSVNSHLDEFIMANGVYGFMAYSKPTNIDYDAECKELDDFIAEWDSKFKITGEPMRFTATGEKRSDW